MVRLQAQAVSLNSCFCLGHEHSRPPYLNLVGTGSLEDGVSWSSVVTTGHLGEALVLWAPPQSPFCVQLCAASAVGSRGFVFVGFLLVWF